MSQSRGFFKSIFDLRGRFEWASLIVGVVAILLVAFFPFLFDCLYFLHNNGKGRVGFNDFLAKYVNNYSCYLWLANCYFIVASDLCDFLKFRELARNCKILNVRGVEVACGTVEKVACVMFVAMLVETAIALLIGFWVIYHQTDFKIYFAIVAYGSFFAVLIEMLVCKLVRICANRLQN